MDPRLAAQTATIRGACRRHGVRALWLIGSAAGGDFDPSRSDVDFLVDFLPLPEGRRADAYFGLREELERLLGRPVDLVMIGAVRNPYFAASVEATKVPLYAAA